MAEEEECPLMALPNEILTMILLNNSCQAIFNFGATCKFYHKFVTGNQYLWKEKYKHLLPHMYNVIEKKGDGQWLMALKQFLIVQHEVLNEVRSMSSKYYSRVNEVTMDDIKNLFELALAHNTNHYYIIRTLQAIVKRAQFYLSYNYLKQSYTLTEMYYAKIALFYLSHTYLAMNWFQKQMKSKLRPAFVLKFFVRWTNPMSDRTDQEIEATIMMLVEEVSALFPNEDGEPNYTVHEKILKGFLKQKDVLHAISKVIYRGHHWTHLPTGQLESFDIVDVMKNKSGHIIPIGVIYQAVAHRCGVTCNLITFPTQMLLEWRDPDEPMETFKIDLETGTLIRNGGSDNPVRRALRYCPDTFLQYIVDEFLKCMGPQNNWSSRNAKLLIDLMSANPSDDNPYMNYKKYLMDYDRLPAMTIPLDKRYMDDSHLKMLKHLVSITYNHSPISRPMATTTRTSRILLAVGMICCHKKYNYLGVITGWYPNATNNVPCREDFDKLSYGFQQPFYILIALDGSKRHVAQENLIGVTRPVRLNDLEDVIGKDFSYFDGFSYVPNTEKESEYPEDNPIRSLYRERYTQRPHHPLRLQ